jgi:hypothetical protein
VCVCTAVCVCVVRVCVFVRALVRLCERGHRRVLFDPLAAEIPR